MTERAIVIHQPWAWAIIHGCKDVENRTWRTKHRGPLLIVAGKTEPAPANIILVEAMICQPIPPAELVLGGVIGRVNVVETTRDSSSPWAEAGMWHWVLDSPEALPYREVRGRPGIFDVASLPLPMHPAAAI